MMSIDITATKKTLPFLLSRRRVASPLLRSRRHFTASDLARPSLSLRSRGPRLPYGLAARRHYAASLTSRDPRRPYGLADVTCSPPFRGLQPIRFADVYVLAAITRPHRPRAALAVLTA